MQSDKSDSGQVARKPRQSYAGYIIFIIVVTIMVLTNPSKQKHIESIVAYYNKLKIEHTSLQCVQNTKTVISDSQIETIVRLKIGNDFKNLFLFSLISNADNGTLTVGVFGNVWLDEKVFTLYYHYE